MEDTGGETLSKKGNATRKSDAARIQSSQAKTGKGTGKGSFSARAQSAADRKK